VERILTVVLTTTQAQAKGAAPSTSREGDQTVAIVATPINVLPPPSTDGVDKLYRQLAEIHTIIAAQLGECTHLHLSDPTFSLVHARAGWRMNIAEPAVSRMASPPSSFSPQGSHDNGASASSPKLSIRLMSVRWARNPYAMHGTHARADTITRRHTTMALRG
jgi:hypothetical protein